ncbi:Ribokinase-like protein [Xylaria longipes]|nr:Ribokinase-like protein [Xylaria longipes]
MGQRASILKRRILRRPSTLEALRGSENLGGIDRLVESVERLPEAPKHQELAFVSLGMIVFDDIEYPDKPKQSALGGENLWATFGARLFRPRHKSTEVGCLVVSRRDHPYPIELSETLESWGVTTVFHTFCNYPINRAHVKYESQDSLRRTKEYETAPFKPAVRNLRDTVLLTAKSYHLSCVPREVLRQIARLLDLRAQIGIKGRPFIVWQPVFVRAAPVDPEDPEETSFEQNLKNYLHILPMVDVFSLNYQELVELAAGPGAPPVSGERDVRGSVEMLLKRIPPPFIGANGSGAMIIRCEPFGYYYRKSNQQGWVKAYSRYSVREPVVDFTGGGSAFMGAFTVAYLDHYNLRDCCRRGAVAASFAMAQFGFPVMTHTDPLPEDINDGEFWNNDKASNRFRLLCAID